MRQLNARLLESLKPPSSGRIELTDTEARGLVFRVTPNNNRSWSLKLSVGGKKLRMSLGEYPSVGLAEARRRAEAKRAELKRAALDGHDFAASHREAVAATKPAKGASTTVRMALDDYYNTHVVEKILYKENRISIMERSLVDYLERPIIDITEDVVVSILEKKKATHPYTAGKWRTAILHFCGWCKRRKYLTTNVAADIPVLVKERSRDRVLTIKEVRRIFATARGLGPDFGTFLQFLLLTAQRRGDVARMRWSEIDFDSAKWSIPSRVYSKNMDLHYVHLSKSALEILEERGSLNGSRELDGRFPSQDRNSLVFSTSGDKMMSGFSKIKKKIDELLVAEDLEAGVRPNNAGISNWTFHDLRTAFATHLGEAGFRHDVIDRILNHAAVGSAPTKVARIYNRAKLLPQRARALNKWESMVVGDGSGLISSASEPTGDSIDAEDDESIK